MCNGYLDYLKNAINNELDNNTKALFVLVGVPGCGKSKLSELLKEDFNAIYVSSDSIRKELLGSEEDQSNGDMIFNEFYKRIFQGMKDGKNVICDATHISKKSRGRYIEQVLQHNKKSDIKYKTIAIEITTPYHICIENDLNRSRTVGKKVIDRMYSQYNEPTLEQGFSCVFQHTYWNDIEEQYSEKDIEIFKNFINEGTSDMVETIFQMKHTIGYQNKLEQTSRYHQENLSEHVKRIISPILFENNEWNSDINKLFIRYPKYKDFIQHHRKLLLMIGLFHDIGKPMCRKKKVDNMKMKGWEMTEPGIFTKNGQTKEVSTWNDYQFIGHEIVSERILRLEYGVDLLMEIGYSTQELITILDVIKNHLLPNELFKDDNQEQTLLTIEKMREEFGDKLFKLIVTFYTFDNNGKVSTYANGKDNDRNEKLVSILFG